MDWDAMIDREKDALLAEHVIGWKQSVHLPQYTTDRNAFAEVEAALVLRGLIESYLRTLILMRCEDSGVCGTIVELEVADAVRVFTAPLDTRCKAALRACGVEVG
jgi:hypothetical protein